MDATQILKEITYYTRLINRHRKFNQQHVPVQKPSTSNGKYKYVKKTENIPPPVVPVVPVKKPTQILLNPNFKQKVLVNPHFKPTVEALPVVVPSKIHVNPKFIANKTEATEGSGRAKTPVATPKILRKFRVDSQYKLVRGTISPATKRTVFKSKYKILRSSTGKVVKAKLRRSPHSVKKKLFDQCHWRRNSFTSKTQKKPNLQFRRISGDLYRISPNVIRRSSVSGQSSMKKIKTVNIRGRKYSMDSNQKTLKLVSSSRNRSLKRIDIGGVTYLQKSPSVLERSTVHRTRNILSQAKQRSIITLTKHRKSNQPCLLYRRFGKCKGKENGRCIRVHDPNQIAVCKKFLQGACVADNCLLSHKVSLEKMPTCKFFLDGCCTHENCPYLHVKINPKAEICRNFLEGYCKDADKCNKRHEYVCPDFEQGKCAKRKCLYPHKDTKPKPKSNPKLKIKPPPPVLEPVEHSRYYGCCEPESVTERSECYEVAKRPRIGDLPSFIPC